ncbi:MAG: hypothetical protein LBL66_09185 [Clostridiales bacterium]|jgi:hypothetical protein|nr:hypothetical protein [Clostridiales bacterium]
MNELWVGVISATSVLAGAVIGALFPWLSGRKRQYSEAVVQNRVDWLRIFSEHIAKVLAEVEAVRFVSDRAEHMICVRKYYRSKNYILSKINMPEPKHKLISIYLNQMDEQFERYDKEKFHALREQLLEVTRQMEKAEWEKAKKEAGGKE